MTIEKYELGGYKLRLFEYRNRWALEIKKGNARKIKSLKTKDLDTAKDEFYKYKLELKEKGRLDIIFDTDLFRQIEIFLEWSKINSNSPNTYEYHYKSMKIFRRFILKDKVEKLTPTTYEKFKTFLIERGNSPRTIDVRLEVIKRMISVLEDLSVIPKDIYPRPKLIKAKRSKAPQFWTSEEVNEVLHKADSTYVYDLIVFGLNTGLRRNELIHLRWEDVNLDGQFILVQGYEVVYQDTKYSFEPKDHEVRRIKLNNVALKTLYKLKNMDRTNIWVFANKYGRPRRYNLDRDLMKITESAHVRHKGAWHCMRRTFAVHLLMEGADLESIRQLLGHSNISTTMAYLNVTDKHLDRTVELLKFGENEENKGLIVFKKVD